MHAPNILSTILKHDNKQTSYKIALLRAINDTVLAYPDLSGEGLDVAVPLRHLAEHWLAYYWAFADAEKPVMQGVRTMRASVLRNDMAFRPKLTRLRLEWEKQFGSSLSSDGYVLVGEMRVPRRRAPYPEAFAKLYGDTLKKIATTLRQPVQYAGPGEWTVFARPTRLSQLEKATAIPVTASRESCLVVSNELWRTFKDVSLWVEALCIHEWSLFTESVAEDVTRGDAYTLLTERPDNRRPLSWERNNIDILMMEGHNFTCPWTHKRLTQSAYDLDHLIPVSVYPTNELWNLVPADPHFNMHVKRARLPTKAKLAAARPHLGSAYAHYGRSPKLQRALQEDAALRFKQLANAPDAPQITEAVISLVSAVTSSRNLATF